VIGRHADGVGRLAEDAEISRRHARIARSGNGFLIEDLGSTNGTHLNGRRVEGTELLSVGDEIEVGGTRMIVQVSSTTPPATQAPIPAAPGEPPAAEEEPAAEEPVAVEPAAADPPTEPSERAPGTPPRVALRIELDLEAGEAHIALDESSDSVRLVFDDGRWRIDRPLE
jgi:pSer/pThr/pTyr-binding forkhead associated (FHA) protein